MFFIFKPISIDIDEHTIETKPKLSIVDGIKPSQPVALSSLLSNDSGFKSEHFTTSSPSSSSSPSTGDLVNHSNGFELKQQISRSSDESVPIMVDCHSTSPGETSPCKNDLKKEENQKLSAASTCEIKPIPIKKSIFELVDEDKNLADASSNFKPTGAVFKSITSLKTNQNNGNLNF